MVNSDHLPCLRDEVGDRVTVTSCGGVRMLGGFRRFSHGHIVKTFPLPREHNQVRLQGSGHFIDNWEGDTIFIKVSSGPGEPFEYVWTHSYDARESNRAPSVCGADVPEGRFSVPFDLTLPHSDKQIRVLVGSTLASKFEGAFDKGIEAFWGMSVFNLYQRTAVEL